MPAVANPLGLDRCGSGVKRAANEPAQRNPFGSHIDDVLFLCLYPHIGLFSLPLYLPLLRSVLEIRPTLRTTLRESEMGFLNLPSPATEVFSNQNSLPSSFAEDPLQSQVLTMRWRCAHPDGVGPMVGSKHVYRHDF